MKKRLFQGELYVTKSSKGRGYGVFAGKKYRKGEKIEECYIIITRGGDKGLEDYYFDAKKRKNALFTGYGIIYNHSDEPNGDYTINVHKRIATIKAQCTIQKDEEIFISYGEDWFGSRGWKAK